MALLRDEFRKLRGIRYFTVLLILLFGANLYICYRGVAVDFRPEMRGYHKTVEAFTDLYREDPARIRRDPGGDGSRDRKLQADGG